MKILVMRPSPSGEELVNNLNKLNIQSWHFSFFNFLPSLSKNSLLKRQIKLYESDIILVFSKMSIYYTNLYLKKNNLQWPNHVKYYAIGQNTADLLSKYVKTIFFPKKEENSEELLNILYQNITKKDKIILLQGENGRNFIQKKLTIQGFNIYLIECYKRVLKSFDSAKEIKKWHQYNINTFIITNSLTLQQLNKIIFKHNQEKWLLTCIIFVLGKRLFALAKKLGWKKIIVLPYANNDFLLKIIQNLQKNQKNQLICWSAKEDLNL